MEEENIKGQKAVTDSADNKEVKKELRKKNIFTHLKDLKLLRNKREQIRAAYNHAWEEFLDLNQEIIKRKETINAHLEAKEGILRNMALEEFKETGSKQLTGGMAIRILKRLEYDPVEALKWAVSHQLAIQLNKKEFEKIMIVSTALPYWLAIKEEPQATIPKEIKDAEE